MTFTHVTFTHVNLRGGAILQPIFTNWGGFVFCRSNHARQIAFSKYFMNFPDRQVEI